MVYAEDVVLYVTDIDMSSAFDTINRHLLLEILKESMKINNEY